MMLVVSDVAAVGRVACSGSLTCVGGGIVSSGRFRAVNSFCGSPFGFIRSSWLSAAAGCGVVISLRLRNLDNDGSLLAAVAVSWQCLGLRAGCNLLTLIASSRCIPCACIATVVTGTNLLVVPDIAVAALALAAPFTVTLSLALSVSLVARGCCLVLVLSATSPLPLRTVGVTAPILGRQPDHRPQRVDSAQLRRLSQIRATRTASKNSPHLRGQLLLGSLLVYRSGQHLAALRSEEPCSRRVRLAVLPSPSGSRGEQRAEAACDARRPRPLRQLRPTLVR
mmetsp:Transcript_16726/g.58488  ORF Transcript_16726/g.58488 Transcript_16726/m.58488 type:complete len:281 (-) Transcript_16726:312-1154(-)